MNLFFPLTLPSTLHLRSTVSLRTRHTVVSRPKGRFSVLEARGPSRTCCRGFDQWARLVRRPKRDQLTADDHLSGAGSDR